MEAAGERELPCWKRYLSKDRGFRLRRGQAGLEQLLRYQAFLARAAIPKAPGPAWLAMTQPDFTRSML